MNKETREDSELRLYLDRIPAPEEIPPGYVLVHSRLRPVSTKRLGTVWLQKSSDTVLPCTCRSLRKKGVTSHYEAKPPPPPPKTQTQLEIERRLAAEKAEAQRVAAMSRDERIRYFGEKEMKRQEKSEQEREALRQSWAAREQAVKQTQAERKVEEERVGRMTDKIVSTGYKKLAVELHPDKKGGSNDAMRELNAAKARLKKAVQL